MGRLANITDEEAARIDRKLDAFFAFTRDAFDDPSILDQIPDGAHVEAVRKEDLEPGRQYDVETPNTVAMVTPSADTARPTRSRTKRTPPKPRTPGRTA